LLFNSPAFLLISLPATFVGFFLIAARNRGLAALWLALASVAFYAVWNPRFVALLLASVVFNYGIRAALGISQGHRKARLLLIFAIAIDLGALAFFKYTDFFITTIDEMTDTCFPASGR
jgi:alginate O-acetyltransferase complex protein AlgI